MSHLIAERIVGAVVIGHGPKIERIQQAPILDEPRAAVAHHVVRAAALLVFEAGGVTAPLNFRHVIAPAAAGRLEQIHVKVVGITFLFAHHNGVGRITNGAVRHRLVGRRVHVVIANDLSKIIIPTVDDVACLLIGLQDSFCRAMRFIPLTEPEPPIASNEQFDERYVLD